MNARFWISEWRIGDTRQPIHVGEIGSRREVALYRHQVEACIDAGPTLLANGSKPHAALAPWINRFDTDEDSIAVWRLRATGEAVYDPGDGNHPMSWLLEHRWAINRHRVEQLALMARDRLVFLCGSVENEDEVWDLFDVVVCLVLDEATLRERLAARTTNRFGKAPAVLNAILSWNRTTETTYREFGAFVVNAGQTPSAVVDQILVYVGAELLDA